MHIANERSLAGSLSYSLGKRAAVRRAISNARRCTTYRPIHVAKQTTIAIAADTRSGAPILATIPVTPAAAITASSVPTRVGVVTISCAQRGTVGLGWPRRYDVQTPGSSSLIPLERYVRISGASST